MGLHKNLADSQPRRLRRRRAAANCAIAGRAAMLPLVSASHGGGAMPYSQARPSMWREQFDYFWDGRRRLAIGWFDGAERAAGAAVRPDLTVISARDERFTSAPTLVDVIDSARWRARIIIIDLPPEHRFVRLTGADGAELILALVAERDLPQGGEWRLLLTMLPDAGGADPVAFRMAAFPARGDVERLSREQTARFRHSLLALGEIGARNAQCLGDGAHRETSSFHNTSDKVGFFTRAASSASLEISSSIVFLPSRRSSSRTFFSRSRTCEAPTTSSSAALGHATLPRKKLRRRDPGAASDPVARLIQ